MPFSTPNTFLDAASIEADEFNENFEAIADAIDGDLIHADGTVAFTDVPSGPATNPSSNNHLARKRYVDEKAGGTKAAYVKTKDSGGTLTTLRANTTSDAVTDLTISVDEEDGHWYRATFNVPEILLNQSTTLGVMPRLAVIIKRGGTEVARQWTENTNDLGGAGVTLVTRPRLATATATVDWTVFVRNGWTAEANVRYKADTNFPMYHYVEDLGLGL
jgi:hypothetical protein